MAKPHYGQPKRMLADGQAAYPPSQSQEQKWKDGADYNAQPGGTIQMSTVDKAAGKVTPGPVRPAYFKPISMEEFGNDAGDSPGRGGYGRYGQPDPSGVRTKAKSGQVREQLMRKTERVSPQQQPKEQLMRRFERIR